jgi:hypothetical protein
LDAINVLEKKKQGLHDLEAFREDNLPPWKTPESRIIGHVLYSPPVVYGMGKKSFTQDFAVVEIDISKINTETFRGNVIDLGTTIDSAELALTLNPNVANPHVFEYPTDRILNINGTIPERELWGPVTVDEKGEPCLTVIKHGAATGLTIGRSNEVYSICRYYYDDRISMDSKEWVVVPVSGIFSKPGDSGAIIVDSQGRIGGMLTGGGGGPLNLDLNYATRIGLLMEVIQDRFPNAHLDAIRSIKK